MLNSAKTQNCFGGNNSFTFNADHPEKVLFAPTYCYVSNLQATHVHTTEAFGPVSTLMPYQNIEELADLVSRGEGSLVASVVKNNDENIEQIIQKLHLAWTSACTDAESAKESTGHGSPLPHLVHGGPGRAGGGEELGGIRAVKHYMQRTAIQGSPNSLTQITTMDAGSKVNEDRVHPFKKSFDELVIGERLLTARRTVTEADIVNFACLSGDYFYAHTDKIAAAESFFW